jgi:hypothetical protein
MRLARTAPQGSVNGVVSETDNGLPFNAKGEIINELGQEI